MDYNRGNHFGVRIHNWVEEQNIRDMDTEGKNRFELSKMRTLALDNKRLKFGSMKSTTHDHMRDPKKQVSGQTMESRGPRERILEANFLRESQEEEAKVLEERTIRYPTVTSSTFKDSYVAPTDEFRRENLAERKIIGLAKPKPVIDNIDELCTDEPVSLYTQRIVEGSFTVSSNHGSNHFARNSTFSAQVEDGIKFHSLCDDGVDIPEPSRPRKHHTSVLGQDEILEQVQRYFLTKHPAIVLEAVALNTSQDIPLPSEQIAKVLRIMHVPLHQRRIDALSVLLEGCNQRQLVQAFLGRQEVDQEEEKQNDRSDDAFYYRATIVAYKSRQQQEVVFGVPKALSKQRLIFPEDGPVVKAILRRQGINTTRVLSLECE